MKGEVPPVQLRVNGLHCDGVEVVKENGRAEGRRPSSSHKTLNMIVSK